VGQGWSEEFEYSKKSSKNKGNNDGLNSN